MSDDMAAHKRGRRHIRRLTKRKIPLPTAPRRDDSDKVVMDESQLEAAYAAAAAANGGDVANSLSELKLPVDSPETPNGAASRPAVDPTEETTAPIETADADVVDEEEASPTPGAADELSEDEPTTNPHIRVGEPLSTPGSGGVDAAWKSDRPAGAVEPPPPTAASEAEAAAAESSGSEAAAAGSPAEEPAIETARPAAASDEGDFESEPETGQHRRADDALPLRKPDSDAPTRPRIEITNEMALAAGRVTSLELPPIRSDAPSRRGSKVPPPGGESRIVSSLTGRRSAFPTSVEDEQQASRPAVIVTRSKVISDRPPKLADADSRRSMPARESAASKLVAPEAEKRDAAKLEPDESPKAEPAPLPAAAAIPAEAEIPEPETAEILKPGAELSPPTAARPSRRPGAPDGEEFETLDIEDGEVESQSMRADAEIDAEDIEQDEPKAPPPPPKRGAPPAPGAQPKAAPPPPPRAPGPVALAAAPAGTSGAGAVATSLPAPATAGAVVSAATSAAAVPAASGGSTAAAAKRASKPQPRRRQWYETLFSDEYLRTVVRPTAAQIARQVDFMQASLGVTKGAAVLDVGCGLGQHALEFARRGCLVVALDLALPMITRAAEDAQQEGLRINFLHKDIRDIGFEGTFDAVVCVGTTFGFFDDEQNREVLGRLANALKPGGRLLLEVVNRDHVLGSQPNLQWFEGDGCVVMEESDFNYYSSRLSVKRTMMREDGRQTESEYSIRLYALHELGQMMQAAGFRVKEVSGGQATRGVFFGSESSRIILLAERRTASPARSNGNGHSENPPPAES